MKPRPPIPPIPAVLLSVASLQGGMAGAKTLFRELGPYGTTSLRVAIAALILLALNYREVRTVGRAAARVILPYGIVLGFMNLAFYSALARLPLGLAVTLEFLGPLGVAVAGSRRALDFVWVSLAGLGIVLISPWSADSRVDLIGVAWALAAAACWAGYILLGQRAAQVASPRAAVTVGMLISAVISVPIGVATSGVALLEPRLVLIGAVVAILSSALPYSLEMLALRDLPARTFGILMSIEPAVAALFGMAVLNEMLTGPQWVAVACVTAASAGAAVTARRSANEAKQATPNPD